MEREREREAILSSPPANTASKHLRHYCAAGTGFEVNSENMRYREELGDFFGDKLGFLFFFQVGIQVLPFKGGK